MLRIVRLHERKLFPYVPIFTLCFTLRYVTVRVDQYVAVCYVTVTARYGYNTGL